jgi:hypothetical protein
MLKDLVKAKQEQPSTSNTVSVATIPESSENSSETESTSESDSDENIRQVEKALSRISILGQPLRISNLRKEISKVNWQFLPINYMNGISMVYLNNKFLIS